MTVEALLQFGKFERRGFWKSNVNYLKNRDMIKDLKEEIDIIKCLKVLTDSDICLWEIIQERIKKNPQIQMQSVQSRRK